MEVYNNLAFCISLQLPAPFPPVNPSSLLFSRLSLTSRLLSWRFFFMCFASKRTSAQGRNRKRRGWGEPFSPRPLSHRFLFRPFARPYRLLCEPQNEEETKKNRQIRRLANPVWVVICQQEPGVPKRALNVSNRRRSANPPIAAHVTNVTTRRCDDLSRHTCAL